MIDRSQYPKRPDLLDQVVDSREEAAEVRRIIYGLTEQDLDESIAWAGQCSGPCDRGRLPCPFPEACERSRE